MIKVSKIPYLVLAIVLAQSSTAQASEGEFTDAVKAYRNENYETAIKTFKKLAKEGDARSLFNLGVMYENGNGVPKNPSEAFNSYKKAAERELGDAENALGNIYYQGNATTKDDKLAIKYYQRAANKGYAKAQFSLGLMYYGAKPESRNLLESEMWFKKAADQNYAPAQYNLGVLYEIEQDLQQPIDAAQKLYMQAAEQRHSGAMINLARIHFTGKSEIPKDHVQALMWAKLAMTSAKTEDERISNLGILNIIKSRMNEKKVNEAAQSVRAYCRKKDLPNCE